MHVIKRNGDVVDVDFAKIHWRIKSVCARDDILNFQKKERPEAYNVFCKLPPILHADVDTITKKTIEGLYNNISTTEIDRLSVEVAQEMCTIHPDNSLLATRILVSNIQKNVLEILVKRFPNVDREKISENLFKYVMRALYFNLDKHGEHSPLVAPYLAAISEKYSEQIGEILDLSRDFVTHDYLGIKMLEKGYLFRTNSMPNFAEKNIMLETPSLADMRVAIGLACGKIPCPPLYPREKVISFLHSYPQVVKEKYRANSLSELFNSAEPHKHKYLDSKLFKQLYWTHFLEEEIQNVQVTEEQWRRIRDTYNGMSLGRFTPATPTRFSAGSLKFQGSSCFLIAMKDDSLKGIYDTLQEQSQISKHAGGVGMHCHNIRSTGSYIAGTGGRSEGLKPLLRVFNASTEYVNQGGRRDGSIAVYVEPWHCDILDFLSLKRKKGADSDRARRLFYALWIPDEFFRCWKEGKDWYLFDPSVCPKLYDSYDEEFSSKYLSDEYVNSHKDTLRFTYLYRKYIRQGKSEKKISADFLMEEVVETIKESGVPYMLSKCACNRKSNQKNLGVIKSSNLCAEIVQFSDANNTAVCNLSSVCLNKFVRPFRDGDNEQFKYDVSINGEPVYYTFDFEEFEKTIQIMVKNTDNLIDINYYPTEASRNSNMKTRPLGLGIQSESDALAALRLPWNSKEAQRLRFYIMERMYYAYLSTSLSLAKDKGAYETFSGSPASQGLLQFDLWANEGKKISFQMSMNWQELKEQIVTHGIRNSLGICLMPTASTSSIFGNSPAVEPFNSLVYVRKSGAGDVTLINTNLVKDLMSINMWNKKMSDKILQNHGSIQDIKEIPKKLRDSYLTVYDMEPEDIIDAAFVRGWFVDQSQSMNLFFKNVTMAEFSKAISRGWSRGLKTLSYYSRTRPSSYSQKAQIDVEKPKVEEKFEGKVCSRDNPDCLSCGS
jgi:ribonucleoside-diphosphate reductase alpha subunit